LGEEWVKEELKKDLSNRHPILQWHQSMVIYQRKKIQSADNVHSIPMTGAIAALTGLAYNLYHIAHNSELQEKLINRLKDRNQFLGAYYETQVVAFFIQAGFEIDFEDEDDSNSTHCEFTAKHTKSGRNFSVEAKARMPGKENAKISNQLYSALKKNAHHERIIFIDINMSEKTTGLETTQWIKEAIRDLREAEKRLKIKGNDAPSAYVFLTNQQSPYNLNNTNFDVATLAESFKIPDFQIDAPFTNLRAAIDSRDKHKEVIDLFESIKNHHKIPSTFDGEIPEFAFGGEAINEQRLIVGNKYLIPDENGKDTIGTLLDPVVMVEKGKHHVHAIYELQNGRKVICKNELTKEEVVAYNQHPNTFFGIYKPQNRIAKDPIELYDFYFETYSKSSKEQLLEFMKNYQNYDELLEMNQEELAKLYCEGLTYHALKEGHFGNHD